MNIIQKKDLSEIDFNFSNNKINVQSRSHRADLILGNLLTAASRRNYLSWDHLTGMGLFQLHFKFNLKPGFNASDFPFNSWQTVATWENPPESRTPAVKFPLMHQIVLGDGNMMVFRATEGRRRLEAMTTHLGTNSSALTTRDLAFSIPVVFHI